MVAKKPAVQQPAPSGRPGPAHTGGAGSPDVPPEAAATRTAPAAEPAPKRSPTRRTPPTGRAQAGKAPARRAPAREAPRGEDSATKASAKRAPARGTPAGQAPPAKRAPTRKASAKKAVGTASGEGTSGTTKGTAGTAAAEKAAGAGRRDGGVQDVAGHSAAEDAGAADAAAQTGATTVSAKKTPGTATAAKSPVPKARIGVVDPGDLAVRPGEDPWTTDEVEEARAELTSEVLRLREEIAASERSLAGLMRDSGDGAGDDDADTGTKNITREHELSLAANAREMLSQFERALQRLDASTYGLCENCGNPIGKARMQAFPRATLCVECKQKQERRY
ncbi:MULTISPECIES: TraR/DksA C4-type zinc finger protein [Streptomyces]|uniref:TraR/DksA C4-type zinc finger protein n=1 Tax=Streptomyces edwardsiae TaxID=3075527 RepID=A0ABU2Q250_9ACTN|nr:TraR/DksA C4-type zinc finger protein [Streptomyces sp. DSM 41636]MDT0398028.1 TraR/DksA C4-type zinc finger protein [Streptomyces sp. DSM 41636]